MSSALYRGRVLQLSVSSPQKRGQYASSYRPKRLKSIHRKSPLPNGTPLKHKNTAQTRSIHDKTGFKDAYLSVAVHPDYQKYLRFVWKNQAFQFKALPFSLNIAPRVFKKLLKPVVAFLRKRGVRLVIYLDDILIIGSNVKETRQFTEMAMSLLESLGFIINREKFDSQSNSGDNLFGVHHQFSQNDLVFAPRQRNQHSLTLSPNAGPAKSYSPSYSSDLGYSRICSSSDMVGPSALSHASSAANTGITTKPQRPCKRGGPFGSILARTALVGSEHHIMQWQSYSDSFPRFHHLHRRIERRLRVSLLKSTSQREVVSYRETPLHQHFGIEGCFSST